MRGFSAAIGAMASAIVVTALVIPGTAAAEPPGIPTADAARGMLDALTVADEGSMSGYSREKFPHWSTVSGACTTRETVLQRDGSGVEVDARCRPTAGSWRSPYDDKTVSEPGDVDIDHVVALAEAWGGGGPPRGAPPPPPGGHPPGRPPIIAGSPAAANRINPGGSRAITQ
ncbi:hypothetical protein [Nocardia wallacei]|uniref:hypothetical protein n=1 Tax=Nocardia wallacei TaxID=480035 RepID=UPI002455BFD0|nr:hypothetical protein [Nocardia wallacei]